jgi:hypothetical protein
MAAHAALPELGLGILGIQTLDGQKEQGREQSQSWRGPVQHNTSWTEHPALGADKLGSKVLKCFEEYAVALWVHARGEIQDSWIFRNLINSINS